MNFCFAKVKLYSVTRTECFKKVSDFVRSGCYHYQISVNVAKLVYAQKNQKLLKCINSADLINADGMPIKIITDIISKKNTARMGGLDYINGLSKRYPNYRYYFLGAKQDVVEKVVSIYREKYNLNIVGWRNGYFNENRIDDIVRDINNKNTDILYLALGSPQKEYMLYDLKDKLKCRFAVGVGGAFDIIAGKTKRAPNWMQKIGLEWFFRLCQEPRRLWKRYLIGNTVFIWLVFKELIKIKILKKSAKY